MFLDTDKEINILLKLEKNDDIRARLDQVFYKEYICKQEHKK